MPCPSSAGAGNGLFLCPSGGGSGGGAGGGAGNGVVFPFPCPSGGAGGSGGSVALPPFFSVGGGQSLGTCAPDACNPTSATACASTLPATDSTCGTDACGNPCNTWLPVSATIAPTGQWVSDGDKVPVAVTFTNNLDDPVMVCVTDPLCGTVCVPGWLRAHTSYTVSDATADTSLVTRANQKYVRSAFSVSYARQNDRVHTLNAAAFTWQLARDKDGLLVSCFFSNTTNTTGILILAIDNQTKSKRTVTLDSLPITLSGNPTVFADVQAIQSPPQLSPATLQTVRFPPTRYFVLQQLAVGSKYFFDLNSQPAYILALPGSNWTAFQVTGTGFTTTTETIQVKIDGDIGKEMSVRPNAT